jgi:hypothetical protein
MDECADALFRFSAKAHRRVGRGALATTAADKLKTGASAFHNESFVVLHTIELSE